jgi:hypothetical protein
MIRKSSVVKLIVLLQLMWLVSLIVLSPSPGITGGKSEAELINEKERLQEMLKKNHEHMREMMQKNEEEKRAIVKQANEKINEAESMKEQLEKQKKDNNDDNKVDEKGHVRKKDDNDHPEDERDQADKQVQENAQPIQVHAPVDNNKTAPGKTYKEFQQYTYQQHYFSN